MYSLSAIKGALKDPHRILREINRQYYNLGSNGPYNSAGIDIFEADWDNMIILDACRYDVFAERATDQLPGHLEKQISRAAATPEFIQAHFSNRTLHDLVYVTGNSWILKIGDEVGADIFNVINAKNDTDFEQRQLTKKAIEAARNFPNKRLLVHYIPPHHPFVGPTADKQLPSFEAQSSDFFSQIRRGEVTVSDELLRTVYAENLERVLPRVEELLKQLPGKTVVTTDHGELLGDRLKPIPIKEYGHYVGLYAEPLVEVPWHTHQTGDRKQIIPEDPLEAEIDKRTQEEIDQHLRDLGYKI